MTPSRGSSFGNDSNRSPLYRCLTCRRRKTRCAGEKPQCSTCTKNGHECLGYPEESAKSSAGANTSASRQDNDDDNEYDDSLTDDADPDADSTSNDGKDATERETSAKQEPPVATTSANKRRRTQRRPASPPPPANGDAASRDPEAVVSFRPDAAVSNPLQNVSPTLHANELRRPVSSGTSHDGIPTSPSIQRAKAVAHRVPYFRYFGPTAIVPGFKQMVVSVRDTTATYSSQSDASLGSINTGLLGSSPATSSEAILAEIPAYDPNSPIPVHSLVIHLVETFFQHVGCNYPFLKENKFMRLVKEKRAEPILVNAVCALAARFSDAPALTGGDEKMPRTERGQVFAQRAKQATVDTFPCPSVSAVQACLLMAYESFGASQDSALWMYLGLAIRMAVDLGLQKRIGVQYQGDKDPTAVGHPSSPEDHRTDSLSLEEQKEVEQERMDTFWAVFILDRIISSGTGRQVTLRDEDFELPLPEPSINSVTGWPTLFPTLVQIIHMYGRVSDVLNNIHDEKDLTEARWAKLTSMEQQLTLFYKDWDQRLQFNADNFKAYLGLGQGNIFILLHFWFHALFIILHQPTLLTPNESRRSEMQLLPDSKELSRSSAKTICDILSFADLIDQRSFIGNPFTNQPIYIAAGAFLMESRSSPSRQLSPSAAVPKNETKKSAKHSLLASAANQNYKQCFQSLQQINEYWGGVKYVMTALGQKAQGLRELETFTEEEYESAMADRRGSLSGQLARLESQGSPAPPGPPIAWSLAGTANSPNSSLTVMYQAANATSNLHGQARTAVMSSRATAASVSAASPSSLAYEAIRQHQSGQMFPPAIPQPNTSSIRHSPRRTSSRLAGNSDATIFGASAFTPTSHHSGYDNFSPTAAGNNAMGDPSNFYGQHTMGFQPGSWPGAASSMDGITFNSQEIDIGSLGLESDIMGGWLDYLPSDVLGLFENHDLGQGSS